MARRPSFWIALAIFQAVFGLTIFAATRAYYKGDVVPAGQGSGAALPRAVVQPRPITAMDPALLDSLATIQPQIDDPASIARQADEYFAAEQYAEAASRYEKLLAIDPNRVDTLNNLGLTLHYLGRSDEALRRINEGIAADPAYQRIWLTLGFVNAQLGRTDAARDALTRASEIDPSSDVGRSAATMLDDLP